MGFTATSTAVVICVGRQLAIHTMNHWYVYRLSHTGGFSFPHILDISGSNLQIRFALKVGGSLIADSHGNSKMKIPQLLA